MDEYLLTTNSALLEIWNVSSMKQNSMLGIHEEDSSTLRKLLYTLIFDNLQAIEYNNKTIKLGKNVS